MRDNTDTEGSVMRLPGGRAVGYLDVGPADGRVVVYCHSVPGSRLLARQLLPVAGELGMRVLAPDRPGVGLSDFQRGRRLIDWPDDVATLADHLGIDSFTVVATSSGCPYVLACAARLPDRVQRAAVVSPVTPADAPGAEEGLAPVFVRLRRLGMRAPWTTRPIMALMGMSVRRSPDSMLQRVERGSPEPDREILADPSVRTAINQGVAEGFRQGARGVAYDMQLMSRGWGFSPADIRPPVDLWQGEQDTTVSTAAARWLAETIPHCRATFLPDAGHMLFYARTGEVLRGLLNGSGEPEQ